MDIRAGREGNGSDAGGHTGGKKCVRFVIDMPGVKSGEIKVQVEDENALLIAGEIYAAHVRKIKPHMLLELSGVGGIFNEEVSSSHLNLI
ncbi:hypothetical protein QQ045_018873 [Rhodiola kirilowii]